jgi:hypothetical protein
MVYTDKIHMVAESLSELHTFAQSMGLHRRYFHGVKKKHPHYDLITKSGREILDENGVKMIDKVLSNGAQLISYKDLFLLSIQMK